MAVNQLITSTFKYKKAIKEKKKELHPQISLGRSSQGE
jgi:hypothetical protein